MATKRFGGSTGFAAVAVVVAIASVCGSRRERAWSTSPQLEVAV